MPGFSQIPMIEYDCAYYDCEQVQLHVEYDCAYYDCEQGQPACRI